MSRRREKYRYFACDFETTVYEGQTSTEVWASAAVEFGTEKVHIFHSIQDTFKFFKDQKCNLICYYHNLKFDGNFWLWYLKTLPYMKEALIVDPENEFDASWTKPYQMQDNTYSYAISDMGQWYKITIKTGGKIIEIRDSLKLLPFSVAQIGKSFDTKHKKLSMEYTGFRYAGCEITPEEQQYIANDVLVIKEALEIMFAEGHNKLTIGACCMAEFKAGFTKWDWQSNFPDIYDMKLDKSYFGSENAGEYIRKSYRGGWCYLVKGKENKLYHNGTTADVNSLYPSMMSSESGNMYPVGMPHFWKGNFIPDVAKDPEHYYFVRVRTRFYIKNGYLPFVQIKGSWFYRGTEALISSDIVNPRTGRYNNKYIDTDGQPQDLIPTLTLTMTDWQLLQDHYNLQDTEILDGCWFYAKSGIFDAYIDKYKKIKQTSKGAKRTLAKLFLNNLYGKMATNTDSSFKVGYLNEEDAVQFYTVLEEEKKPGYIPCGSAITSYARNFTIRAAQKNYHGKNRPGFIYADTDSIHCDLPPDQIKGIRVHDTDFCAWKLESCWDTSLFVRQKTYIEHVIAEDLQPVAPYYNIRCAGLPETCKELFLQSMEDYTGTVPWNISQDKKDFLSIPRQLTDFKIGLRIPGKLLPKNIPGGVLLVDSSFELRPI